MSVVRTYIASIRTATLAARWQIQLFGDLAICPANALDGGEAATRFRWHKVGSLLARLAWKPGERLARELLIDLLWPDEDLDKGRENLRAALASLRRQLEPPGVESGTILVTQGRSHVSLNPDAIQTDVARFEQALRQGCYAEALALYKGPLLPDLYDDWVLAERERLEQMASKVRRRQGEKGPSVLLPSPELASPSASQIHLPFRLTRFYGRENEIAHLSAMLRRERLVTVTGAGGTGKTRFAVEVAQAMAPDFASVCFVPLADLTNASSLPGHIASHLAIVTTPRIESLDALATSLNQRPGSLLLALDNFEHLSGEERGPNFVQGLLARVPSLTCLVTSRHRLGIEGEREFPLLPLAVPPVDASPEHLMTHPSVSLFVDRAQGVRPDFQLTPRNAETVARLVEHLEGIPLSLELAASWMKSFSVSRILEDISRRSVLVSRGKHPLPSRQTSLRATLDHSLFLLTDEMRRLLLGLSVFRGGWTADAAVEVCQEPNAAVLLTQLRERSLLYSEEIAGEMRFRMLEVLREYVAEQVDEEESLLLARRHLAWYQQLVEIEHTNLLRTEQLGSLDRVDAERANIFAALDFGMGSKEQHDHKIGGEIYFRVHHLFLRPYPATAPGRVPLLDRNHTPARKVLGFSLKELAVHWWQWILPLPIEENPMVQATNTHTEMGNQVIPGITFLCGVPPAVTPTVTVSRFITIPTENILFFPLVNHYLDNTNLPGREPTLFTPDELLTVGFGMDLVTSFQNIIQHGGSLFLTVDGVPMPDLANLLQINGGEGFDVVYVSTNNVSNAMGYDTSLNTGVYPSVVRTAGIGYWAVIGPLPPGEHLLTFGAAIPYIDSTSQPVGYTLRQYITYTVIVGTKEKIHNPPTLDRLTISLGQIPPTRIPTGIESNCPTSL